MDRTKSSLGRKLLRQWFLKPSRSLMLISERQSTIEYILDGPNTEVMNKISKLLRKFADPIAVIRRIKRVHASHTDWTHLLIALDAVLRIYGEYCYCMQTPSK